MDGITTGPSCLRTTVRAAEVRLPFYGERRPSTAARPRIGAEAYRAGGAPIPGFAVTTSFGEVETFVTRASVVLASRGWGSVAL